MDLVGMVCLAPVMVAVAIHDLRYMRIPNSLSLISFGILAVVTAAFPPDDLVIRVIVALSVLALGLIGFVFRLVGGGDVKILAVLMLAVPSEGFVVFAYVFSAAMFVGIGIVLLLRRVPQTASWGWKSFGGSSGFPMGLSIALAGLSFPLFALLARNA